MSYESQSALANDPVFSSRNRSCAIQQAQQAGVADASPASKALADGVMRDDGPYISTFIQLSASGPGVSDEVDNGDGTIDQTKVTDAELLTMTQGNWPIVAALYFDDTGAPLSR